jgi:hypothetical protein
MRLRLLTNFTSTEKAKGRWQKADSFMNESA